MIHHKDTVDFRVFSVQILYAIIIAEQVWKEQNLDLWITSVSDSVGDRVKTSLHPSGLAFDMRILPKLGHNDTINKLLADNLRTRLGPQYDVVLETDHIHCEFDPPAFMS